MPTKRWPSIWGNPSLWLIVAMLAVCALLHYSPHVAFLRAISPEATVGVTRHVMDRILFLLPITYAAFIFGVKAGLLTTAAALAIMLPRAISLSPVPRDALLETGSVILVACMVVFFFHSQRRERERRLQTLLELEAAQKELKQHIQVIEKDEQRLATLNAVSNLVNQSLELQYILNAATDKVIEVMGMDAALVFLWDKKAQELVLGVYGGVSEEFAAGVRRMGLGEGFNGLVAQTGEPMVVEDASQDRRLTREVVKREGLKSQLIVPLKSKGEVVGTLCVAKRERRQFLSDEVDLLSSIANQIGISIENARLYEDERKVAEQLRISEKTYRDLFDNASDAILVHDLEGRVLAANPAVAKLVGYDREALIGRMVQEFLPEHNMRMAQEIRHKLLSGENIEQPYEQRLIRRDGSQAIVKIATSLISDGNPRGFQHVARDVTDEERAKENLRFYVQQATRAQEEERKRIARELHDDTAQGLIVLSRQLEKLMLNKEQLPKEDLKLLEDLQRQTDALLEGVRRFSQDLRPSVLDDLGLLAALEFLASDMTKRGIATDLSIVGEAIRLPSEIELLLFRIAQEALRNVWRHSQATTAEVRVEFSNSRILVVIKDNGKGFELPQRVGDLASAGKLGLAGIQERARLIGGTVTVQSKLGAGTTVTVEVPLQ